YGETDNDDYIVLSGFPDTSGPITVSYWGNIASADIGDSVFGGYGTDSGNDRFQAHAPWSDGTLYWDYGDYEGDGRISTAYGAYDDKWTYVTLVSAGKGGSFKAIYLDGSLITSDSGASDGPDGNITFRIGGAVIVSSYEYNGIIDEFRLYGGTRHSMDILTDYNNQSNVGTFLTFGSEQGASQAVDRAGSNNGEILGAVTAVGRIGQALEFDGVDDYVDINDSANISPTADITISAWVKLGSTGISQAVVDKRIDGSGQYSYWIGFMDTNKIRLWISEDGTNSNRGYFDTTNTFTSSTGWYHIAGTLNNGTFSVYVNGINEPGSLTDGASSIYDSTSNLRFGQHAAGIYFDGLIDDVRIYNRALSAKEIERMYQLGETTHINTTINTNPDLKNGLVGHWTFDGQTITGSGVADQSGQGNDCHFILYGNATSTKLAPGKIGQAVDLDGSLDWLTCGTGANPQGNMTASAWVQYDALSRGVLTTGDHIGDRTGFMIGINNAPCGYQARFNFNYYEGNGSDYISICSDSTKIFSPSETFIHVAMTYDGTTLRGYVDGVQATTTDTGTAAPSDDPFIIGKHLSTYNDYEWYGKIDDVRIYNRALSAGEIKRLYHLGK
ncbi:LamG-like jellyroll fold domain-containing protein, partial [Patescibacteria group bacterium]